MKKLVEAKWSRRNGEATTGLREPRVLFLADRNIRADQARESFKFAAEGACYRLEAGTDDPPMDRTVYFTIYQTLLGKGEADELTDEDVKEVRYKKFQRDFFDLVIIDECHRGGARDESAWRVVLDYFGGASHLGLTATPRRDVNGDTYAYFGEPVYRYSLRQGVSDGFLTPYRVKRCRSTLTTYKYQAGDVVSGDDELDKDKYYSTDELERERIRIKERDRHFVRELYEVMPANEKALVFCATQEHALRIAQIIREEARRRGVHAAHYCERVTAEDGEAGERFLRQFRNSENLVPTVLTTSRKLSTGVDACNIRSIVLMRGVKSMVEFKQIVGRGTRLFDGKPYFTIYDFTDATDKFTDPEWDGETPSDPPGGTGKSGISGLSGESGEGGGPCPVCGCAPCICETPAKRPIDVKLASGRVISAYWEDKVFFDSEMLSAAEFLTRFAKAVREATRTPELLRESWADMARRKDLIDAMELAGFDPDRLREIQLNTGRQAFDILDVMLDIAYDVEPVTRAFRARRAEREERNLGGERKALFEVIVGNYVRDGVWTLTAESFRDLLLQRYATISGAYSALGFGSPEEALAFYGGIQREIYAA